MKGVKRAQKARFGSGGAAAREAEQDWRATGGSVSSTRLLGTATGKTTAERLQGEELPEQRQKERQGAGPSAVAVGWTRSACADLDGSVFK